MIPNIGTSFILSFSIIKTKKAFKKILEDFYLFQLETNY